MSVRRDTPRGATSEQAPGRGDVQRDAQGSWVVLGAATEAGQQMLSRVRFGSLAHQVIAQRDARWLPPDA